MPMKEMEFKIESAWRWCRKGGCQCRQALELGPAKNPWWRGDEEALAETLPKRLSLTDPLARWTAAPGGPAFFAYSTNYLIDVEHGVIMDVEPTPAHRTAEVESTKTMIERVEEHFDIKPDRLIGDTAYKTACSYLPTRQHAYLLSSGRRPYKFP